MNRAESLEKGHQVDQDRTIPIFELRDDEPAHAFLWDPVDDRDGMEATSCHGTPIDLSRYAGTTPGRTLHINANPAVGNNPNRYKQHGFYFNADNCIGCHACETACSEKNDNPAHIAFRSVGYVEGGTYPDYQRINISMACNHCEDPVCMKGCPTRAYTKFAEYGAVLQDPDICFGCGYCTWVCPYNAPQLDPIKGQVTKCNMCVDRLEVGLKPACVSACLGNALDFGVVENIPQNRIEAKTQIPGFPSPDISRPNIRFQQTRGTQLEMSRPDGMPVKYHKAEGNGQFRPEVDRKHGDKKAWNWRKLLTSHESAHVLFTLSTQAVLGAFALLYGAMVLPRSSLALINSAATKVVLLPALIALLSFGLYKLNMHLGKPHRFYRGFNNLRWSPVSREIAGISGFFVFLLAYCFFSLFDGGLAPALRLSGASLALVSGAVGLYYMYRIYRIPARPFWDHWQTATAFAGNAISLGALLVGLISLPMALLRGEDATSLASILLAFIVTGLSLETLGHIAHHRDMKNARNEGASSWYLQTTRYGYPWLVRNALLVSVLLFSALGFFLNIVGVMSAAGWIATWLLLSGLVVAAALISRSMFFVLVIPTTMPGAFFWKNQDFIAHARETGLADLEQVGVVRERHGRFKFDELLETVRNTGPRDVIAHLKDIFVWRKIP